VTAVTGTVTNGVLVLPVDLLEIIGVYDEAGREYVQQPLQMARQAGSYYYAISGANLVTPGPDGNRQIQYYAKIPTLTTSLTTSNWVLANHPGLYLYGVGLEAAKYIRDVEQAQAMAQLVEMEFDAVRVDDDRLRYSRARVRVVGATP
jgi:hypothetical protein